jgi:CRISPR-associated protein Cmr3
LAEVEVEPGDTGIPPAPEPVAGATGLLLTLLTPVDLGGTWLPPAFGPDALDGGATAWRGELAGIRLTIHSAVIGPAVREGGWDLAARRPRPVQSLIPAGSAWFATVQDPSGRTLTGQALAPAAHALHGTQIAGDPLGHGQLAVGFLDSTRCPDLEVPQ